MSFYDQWPLWRLFHNLWTRDVGTEGYEKAKWISLEQKILMDMSTKRKILERIQGMSKTNYEDVAEFHKKFSLYGPVVPGWVESDKALLRRFGLISEEYLELERAFLDRNLPVLFDNLIDLVYVCMGMAYMLGLPWQEGWDAVHKANMQKVLPRELQNQGKFEYKIQKPEGWQPPNIVEVLKKHEWKEDPGD